MVTPVKIDWLEGTIPNLDIYSMLDRLRVLFPDFQEVDHGGLGYESSAIILKTGRVYWSTSRPRNGVHISLPPSAIELSQLDYVTYAQRLYALGAKFTRVDLAADDTQGILNMEMIVQAVELGHFVSTAKKKPEQIIDYEGVGRTFYFGRAQSKTRIRLYDKAAEQHARGKLYVGHWIRVETQLRAERADAAVRYILEHPTDFQAQVCGWLRSALDFKMVGSDSNKSRWETADWWLSFLDFASKERLFISRRILTIDDLVAHLTYQQGPTMLVVERVLGKDALSDIANSAARRLKPKHLALIKSAFGTDDEEETNVSKFTNAP
jgi:putative DNA relaxase